MTMMTMMNKMAMMTAPNLPLRSEEVLIKITLYISPHGDSIDMTRSI